jgi:chromate reductase
MDPTAASARVLQIAGIAGSLRQGSFNRGLLRAAAELAPPTLQITIHDLWPIPLYNGDVEAQGVPEAVVALREAVRVADGLLIATPEYNTGCRGSSRTRSTGCRGRPKPAP